MFGYAAKRIRHSWKLFVALIIATTISTAFFAGANSATDFLSRQATEQSLRSAQVDCYMFHQFVVPRSSYEIEPLVKSVSKVQGVIGSEIIAYLPGEGIGRLAGTNITIVGIQNDSLVRRGMTLVSGSEQLGVNEAYVWSGSPDLNSIGSNGSTVLIQFTLVSPLGGTLWFTWNFTVKGLVNLSDKSQAIAEQELSTGLYGSTTETSTYKQEPNENILLVSWEATFEHLLNVLFTYSAGFDEYVYVRYITTLRYGLIVTLDKNALVNPYDIEGSISNLRNVDFQLENLDAELEYHVYDYIVTALQSAASQLTSLRFTFLGIAIMIFIIAWFLGSATSGITYNLRRREIGLLSARGLSSNDIKGLFVTEARLIGIFSGLVGFLVGIVLIPLAMGFGNQPLAQTASYLFSTTGALNLVSTLILGGLLANITVYRAAKRAANMKTVDALKEYGSVEDGGKVHGSKLVWIAFILGTYKIVVWILGVNMASVLAMLPANVVVYVFSGVMLVLDSGLSYLAPILFLYGAAKLVTQGFSWIHKKIGSAGRKAFGETGRLATRNVQRNLARTATVAFLVALVVGYGVFVVTTSASDYDYRYRAEYASVGADVRADLTYSSDVSYATNAIRNMPGVQGATYQRSFTAQVGVEGGSLITVRFKAVDPSEWLNVSYYENEWFRGSSAKDAFHSLSFDFEAVILDKSLADLLNLKVGGWINVYLPEYGHGDLMRHRLRVAGLYGPDLSSQGGGTTQSYNSALESFVPIRLLNPYGVNPKTNDTVIVKLIPSANLTQVIGDIAAVDSVEAVTAAQIELGNAYSNFMEIAPQGLRNVGVVLAVVAASLETAIIVSITLHERRKEIALLSVRGMSSRQLLSMLLVEIGAVAALAIVLGAILGMIVAIGSLSQPSLVPGITYSEIVSHRLVLPFDSVLMLVGLFGLVMLATTIPVFVVARSMRSGNRMLGRVRA